MDNNLLIVSLDASQDLSTQYIMIHKVTTDD